MSEQSKRVSRYEKLDELIVETIRGHEACKWIDLKHGACAFELYRVTKRRYGHACKMQMLLTARLQALRKKGVIRAVDRKLWTLADAA